MTFDYIIVGTGPAGCFLAKSLSDNGKHSVLLLEAGENNNNDPLIKISTNESKLYNYFPQYFWQGVTKAYPTLNNRHFTWSTGRLLGGGSSVNGEQYVRPTPAVLEQWEQIAGPLWSPSQATEHFKELEAFQGLTLHPMVHGYSGRVNIRQAPMKIPLMTQKIVWAMEQATGFKSILDYNDPSTPIGPFHRWELFQKPNGNRESASTAFLSEDVMTPDGYGINGRDLRVLFKSTALRVLFNSFSDAIGVEYLIEGKLCRSYSLQKVIVSAGINSPQLLMLSGIGNSTELSAAGVSVIYDNPNVGYHLKNHGITVASFTVNQEDVEELNQDLNALYTSGAFLPNTNKNTRQIQLIGSYSNGVFRLLIINLLPKSSGTVKLQNNDPLKIVLADEGYFTSPEDLEVVKGVYQYYIKSIAEYLSSLDSKYQLISPGMDVIHNDVLLEKHIRETMFNAYHQQCTLRMAPLQEGGVVDSYGRVYGVNRLVVADNSILPSVADCNTTSTSYLVAATLKDSIERG